MSNAEPKGGNLLKRLKKEIVRGGAGVFKLTQGAPRGALRSVQKQARSLPVQRSVEL